MATIASGNRRSRMAAGRGRTPARLAIRVCVALLRIEATPAQVSATGLWCHSRTTGACPATRAAPISETLLEIDRLNYLPEYILRKATSARWHMDSNCAPRFWITALWPALWVFHRRQRFTTPAKLFLAPALAPLADLDPFARKKRGFNPPIDSWLRGDLAPRLDGLGARLSVLSSGQLVAFRVDRFVAAWRGGASHLAEQLLQLVILEESLRQLAELATLA